MRGTARRRVVAPSGSSSSRPSKQGRADELQEPVRPFVSDRAQTSRGQPLDQGGERVVSEHGRGRRQEGFHLEPARLAGEHARLAHELAPVSIERALAAPVCGEEERRGLALPRQSAVDDRTEERPDDVTLHAGRDLADDTRVREETCALDQVTGVHGRAGMEGGERQGGEGTREVAFDALLEQVVHRRCVAGDLAGQRLDRLSREAGRLGPEDQGMRVSCVPHRLRPIGLSSRAQRRFYARGGERTRELREPANEPGGHSDLGCPAVGDTPAREGEWSRRQTAAMTGSSKPRGGLADALFTSVQQRVLGLLFGQPDRRFQSAELIRLAKGGVGAVHRQMGRLAEAELVTVTRSGNQKHYQARRDSRCLRRIVTT